MRWSLVTLALISIMGFSSAVAHEVSASQVKVYTHDAVVEVWQTTPYRVAHGIAQMKSNVQLKPVTDQAALQAIADGWEIKSAMGTCELKRQAFRRVHHDTQLQLRFLFECPESGPARLASMAWLNDTPKAHFVFLDDDTDAGMKRRVIERGNITFAIDGK